MRISDWSSDVCSSDLAGCIDGHEPGVGIRLDGARCHHLAKVGVGGHLPLAGPGASVAGPEQDSVGEWVEAGDAQRERCVGGCDHRSALPDRRSRSEEHTSELQSLMRSSYAVLCLEQKKTQEST